MTLDGTGLEMTLDDRKNFTYCHRVGVAFAQSDRTGQHVTSVMVSVIVVPSGSASHNIWKGGVVKELKPMLDQWRLDELVRQRQEAIEHRKALEEIVKNLSSEIGAMLDLAGIKTTQSGDWIVTLADRTSPSRLVPEKLLDLGVPADVIAEATEPGKPYTCVDVRRAKQ